MNINKRSIMNKFKKIGLTALAGSLAAVSAHAGEMSVSAGANLTYKHGNNASPLAGRGVGSDMDLAFSGGGELDNGTTFSVNTATLDSVDGLTSSYITISTPSFGTFTVGHSFGSAAGKYDEEVPQVYEQISDGSDSTQGSANKIGDFMDNNVIAYTSPALEVGGASITLDAAYSPQAVDSRVGDGSAPSHSQTIGAGQELGITIAYEGLKLGAYGAERERTTAGQTQESDEFNGVWYAKYSFGPVSIGYSESYLDSGQTGAATATNTAKALDHSPPGIFENVQMSVAFNINENFSISYTDSEDTYNPQSGSAGRNGNTAATTAIKDVVQDVEAIQVAYSMGGMSIKAYQMETTNPAYNEAADDTKETEIALGLAF